MSTQHLTGRSRLKLTIAAVALVAAGGAAGAFALAETRPSVTMAPATPVAIRSLASGGIVTVRGRVVEVYGNSFVMADATGRALVDTGPEGEEGLVKASDPVTIQGRFDHGVIHAAFLVSADGTVTALGPLDRRGPGRRGEDHRGSGDQPGPGIDGPARAGRPDTPAR